MRITNQLMVNNAIGHMEENLNRLYQLQEKVASGKQFKYSSDDPSKVAMAQKLYANIETNSIYIDTGTSVDEWMSSYDTAFSQTIDIAQRAHDLILGGMSDTLSADERYTLGQELSVMVEEVIEVGNYQYLGKYIFSGFQTSIKPFVLDSSGAAVSYHGDTGSIQQNISPGQLIKVNHEGEQIFKDLYESIIDGSDALCSNDTSSLEAILSQLNSAIDTIDQARTVNGARQRQVRSTLEVMERTRTELKSLLSQKEDVNMAEAISLMQNQETNYQTVLEVGQRAISALTLFDIIR